MDGRIGLYGPGNEIDLIDIRRIEARAPHGNEAARDIESGQ